MKLVSGFCALGIGGALFFSANVSAINAQENNDQRSSYPTSLRDSLSKDGSPRALALASMVHAESDPSRYSAVLLQRARAQAPDDPLINWLIALDDNDPTHAAAAHDALLRVEPGNGAVYWAGLNLLERSKAETADSVLAQMASATYFDEHLGDAVVAWLDHLQAHPELKLDSHELTAPLIRAMTYAALAAIPDHLPLLNACGREAVATRSFRLESCRSIGKLLAFHATTLVSRRMGLFILQEVDPAHSTEHQRAYRYLATESADLLNRAMADPRQGAQLIADWRETRSEIAVLERLLSRAGKPLMPPGDWSEHAHPITRATSTAASEG